MKNGVESWLGGWVEVLLKASTKSKGVFLGGMKGQ